MGLLDVLLGRSKPATPNLDVLFAVPSAAYTLQAALGFVPTGAGGVCFKPAEGAASARTQNEITELLGVGQGSSVVEYDEYGYAWVICRQPEVSTVVTELHAVNTTLSEAGFGTSLLCTVIGFTAPAKQNQRLGLVYLFKRGTFYPFAPTGNQTRNNALELQVRATLNKELPIEADLTRWFPLWSAPVL